MSVEIVDITALRFVSASVSDQRAGLIGYLSFVVGKTLRIDGVTMRRTRRGEFVLSYPERRDRRGRRHTIICPIDRDAQMRIERRVLELLSIENGGRRA